MSEFLKNYLHKVGFEGFTKNTVKLKDKTEDLVFLHSDYNLLLWSTS